MNRCSGFFVAATDTGVGKTVVTAAMALALRERGQSVGVFKPVQSGFDRDDPDGDTMLLRRWLELDVTPESLNMAAFGKPLAPLVAARLAGEEIILGPIVDRSQQLSKQYDDTATVLAAYNWGPGRINSRIRRGIPLPVVYSGAVLATYAPDPLAN